MQIFGHQPDGNGHLQGIQPESGCQQPQEAVGIRHAAEGKAEAEVHLWRWRKQFYHYFEIATKMEGKAGDNLVTCLESRLDSVVFRMGLALTRREARQLVTHKHFTVNGVRVDIPSYRVKVGDVIALHDTSKSSQKFKDVVEQTADRTVPLWLDVNKEAFSATVTRMPVPEDLDYEVAAHLIVELYSK